MEIATQIVGLLTQVLKEIPALAWPALVGLGLYWFRDPIRKILQDANIKASREGFSIEHPELETQKKGQETSESPLQFSTTRPLGFDEPWLKPWIDELEGIFKTAIEKFPKEEREERLLWWAIEYGASGEALRLHRFIFGSQIHFLETLRYRSMGMAEAKVEYYDPAVKKWPDVYKNYSFEQWLNFLITQNLVHELDLEIAIRPKGVAFIGAFEVLKLNRDKEG